MIDYGAPDHNDQIPGMVRRLTMSDVLSDMVASYFNFCESRLNRSLMMSDTQRVFSTGSVRDSVAGKLRYDLIPPTVLERLAKVYTHGAEQYGDRNWEKGQPFSAIYGSLVRHLQNWMQRKPGAKATDDDIAQVIWNAAALLFTEEQVKAGRLPAALDDRPGLVGVPWHVEQMTPGFTYFPAKEASPIYGFAAMPKSRSVRETPRPPVRDETHKPPLNGQLYKLSHFKCKYAEPYARWRSFGNFVEVRDDGCADERLCGGWRPSALTVDKLISEVRTGILIPADNIRTVYIAGPMRGIKDSNFPAFDAAKKEWEVKGWNVISPADLDREAGPQIDPISPASLRAYMTRDTKAIIEKVDALVMLNGWSDSKGAKVEFHLAEYLGLPIYRQNGERIE
jgi:hypothetical protein